MALFTAFEDRHLPWITQLAQLEAQNRDELYTFVTQGWPALQNPSIRSACEQFDHKTVARFLEQFGVLTSLIQKILSHLVDTRTINQNDLRDLNEYLSHYAPRMGAFYRRKDGEDSSPSLSSLAGSEASAPDEPARNRTLLQNYALQEQRLKALEYDLLSVRNKHDIEEEIEASQARLYETGKSIHHPIEVIYGVRYPEYGDPFVEFVQYFSVQFFHYLVEEADRSRKKRASLFARCAECRNVYLRNLSRPRQAYCSRRCAARQGERKRYAQRKSLHERD